MPKSWRTRRNRSRLRFLLEVLDLVLVVAPDATGCEELWADGLTLARRFWKELSGSERSLWKLLGERLGHPREFIEKSLGIPPSETKPEHDLIAQSNLNKIAIVSLNESAARQAAEIIQQHTKASILLINDKAAGASTDSAKNADVILFVWSATKHAVYRAFDSVRDKIEYVSGGGASSIVLALERRLSRQAQSSTSAE